MNWLRRKPPVLLRLHMRGDDPSVEGVFVGFQAGCYRLANAKLLVEVEHTVPLLGEAWVPRENVLYGQVLG